MHYNFSLKLNKNRIPLISNYQLKWITKIHFSIMNNLNENIENFQ